MSTIRDSALPYTPPPGADPFRHGWRYVQVTHADGSIEFDQIPLTMEDVLHPEEGDVNVQTDGHMRDCLYLRAALEARVADDPSAVVLTDCRVDFGAPGVRPLGPDIVVFRGLQRRKDWSTFDVLAEGAQPQFVIEVTSPEYRRNDAQIKVDYYHRAGVPLYVIVDSDDLEQGRRLRFFAFQDSEDGYEPIELTDRRVWLEPVGLWLEVAEGYAGERVSLYDPKLGRDYGTYTEEHARAESERARANTATDRAEAERNRANAATDRADAERVRANVAIAEAEAERNRANAEATARLDLEDQLRQMAEELRRLRGNA